jgi:uncharacterized RDD family membrane protein YckC
VSAVERGMGPRWRRADDAKLVREIVTPEGIPLRFTQARAGDRAAAFVIDVVIQLALVFGIVFLLQLSVGGEPTWLRAVAILLVFLVLNFYFVFFEVRWQGATPGKRMTGIRVIDARGGQLETSAVLARNLIRHVEVWLPLAVLVAPRQMWPGAPGWALIVAGAWAFVFMFMPLFNRDRRRIGDLVAGTRVVTRPKITLLPDLVAEHVAAPPPFSGRAPAPAVAAHVFDDAQLSIYGIYELQVLEQALRGNAWEPGHLVAMATISEKIRAKIRFQGTVTDDERFLRDFYAALRAHLEQKMLFGHRREDKYSK